MTAQEAKANMEHFVKVYSSENGPRNFFDTNQFLRYTLDLAKAAYEGYPQYTWDGEWKVYQAKKNLTTKSGSKILRGDYVIGCSYKLAGIDEQGYIEIPVFRHPSNSLNMCVFGLGSFREVLETNKGQGCG